GSRRLTGAGNVETDDTGRRRQLVDEGLQTFELHPEAVHEQEGRALPVSLAHADTHVVPADRDDLRARLVVRRSTPGRCHGATPSVICSSGNAGERVVAVVRLL